MRLWLALVLLLALLLFLLGNNRVPLWDRDEPRYAQTSRQMLADGDWVLPHFLNRIRYNKPPFIYWCQATAMRILGDDEGAARLPSSVAVFVGAGLLGIFLWRRAGESRAFLTTVIFCTSAATIASAKLCLTDGVMLLWMVIGQGALYRLRFENPTGIGVPVVFWVSVGLSALTKGYAPVMQLATMMVLGGIEVGGRWRSGAAWKEAITWWRRLRPLLGLGIVAAIVGPWMVLVFREDPQFLSRLWSQAVLHTTSGTEGHGHPPGYHLVMIWATFFPWCLLLPTAIGIGIRHRDQPLSRFALAAAIGPWLVMECVTNKLPFYILPCFPALSFLVADAVFRSRAAVRHEADDDLKRPVFLLGVAAWGIAALGLAAGPWIFLDRLGDPARWPLVLLTVVAVGWTLIVAVSFIRKWIFIAVGSMAIGLFLISVLLFGIVLPNLPALKAGRTLGYKLSALEARPVYMLDYREPSMAYYEGGRDIQEAEDLRPGWNTLTDQRWNEFSAQTRAKYEIVWKLSDVLEYAGGGKTVNVLIVRSK